MNPPDKLNDSSRASGWLNKLLDFVKMCRLVEGTGYRLIQTTRGTALEIEPSKGGGGGPVWRGEWSATESYSVDDVVIRGGITVAGDSVILSSGEHAGTWIAVNDPDVGEVPGLSSSTNWELYSRVAAPVFAIKSGTIKILSSAAVGKIEITDSAASSSGIFVNIEDSGGYEIKLRRIPAGCVNGVIKYRYVLCSDLLP